MDVTCGFFDLDVDHRQQEKSMGKNFLIPKLCLMLKYLLKIYLRGIEINETVPTRRFFVKKRYFWRYKQRGVEYAG